VHGGGLSGRAARRFHQAAGARSCAHGLHRARSECLRAGQSTVLDRDCGHRVAVTRAPDPAPSRARGPAHTNGWCARLARPHAQAPPTSGADRPRRLPPQLALAVLVPLRQRMGAGAAGVGRRQPLLHPRPRTHRRDRPRGRRSTTTCTNRTLRRQHKAELSRPVSPRPAPVGAGGSMCAAAVDRPPCGGHVRPGARAARARRR
jgi:hypothetical protein